MKGIFVTGTDTSVGKTWVGEHLIKALVDNGLDVVPRKPVESGWADNVLETDAWILASAASKLDELDKICPHHFKTPVSPVRAAEIERKSISLSLLKDQCLADIKPKQFLYVEGAGGFYSPLCSDGLNADLASELKLPVLLVVANRLGCINHALLTVEAIKQRKLTLQAIVLNDNYPKQSSPDMDNLADLKKLFKYPIISIGNDSSSKNGFKLLANLIT